MLPYRERSKNNFTTCSSNSGKLGQLLSFLLLDDTSVRQEQGRAAGVKGAHILNEGAFLLRLGSSNRCILPILSNASSHLSPVYSQ